MGKPGPKERVSDDRLLLEIHLAGGTKIQPTEINDDVGFTVQHARDRLNEIAETTDYLDMNKISGRNHYDLTEAGLKRLTDTLRGAVD